MKTFVAYVWLVMLVAGLARVTQVTHLHARNSYKLIEAPPLADLDTNLLNIGFLGYRGLYDDFINIWTLQVLMDERLRSYDPLEVQRNLLTVTRHRPRLESLYMISCFVLAMDFERPDLCEPLTLDGLQAFPTSWRIPMTQGFMYAYRMNDIKNAAMYYGLAASREDAPPFLKKLAVNMVSRNSLSVTELQESLDALTGIEGGSKFAEFLLELSRHKENRTEEQK